MNMGVHDLPVGSLSWTNDSFQATTERGVNISGTLISSNSVPTRLLVQSERGGRTARRIVYYSYTKNLGLLIPNQIVVKLIKRGREIEDTDITIEKLIVADAPLAMGVFDPTAFIRAKDIPDYHLNAGGYAHTNASGRVSTIKFQSPH